MQSLAVIAKLRPGAWEEATKLIELGPPFNPAEHGIVWHAVYLTSEAAIFVFEGEDPNSLLAALGGPDEQAVLGAWEPLLDGTPLIARAAYHWPRADAASDGSDRKPR
jgi:hypothetical protein